MTREKATAWNEQEARRMRDDGATWALIGERFGVSPTIVHCRLDPVYKERRREQKNYGRSDRDAVERKAEAPNFHRVLRLVEDGPERQSEPPPAGVYRRFVPNRIALALPVTETKQGCWVSLPYVSILGNLAENGGLS